MWLRTLLVLLCVSGAFVGCAKDSTRLMADQRSVLKSAPLHSTFDEAPTFRYASRGEKTSAFAGGLLFGLLFVPAAMAMDSSHDDLAAAYRLGNPSQSIEQTLTQRMVSEYGLGVVRPSEFVEVWEELATLKRHYSQGLLLQVRTVRWGLEPSSWSQFHVVLKSSARLVSVREAKEIWYATCTSEKVDEERDPKLEDLKANDGDLLKTMVKEAIESCAVELWSKMKGI
jgi:hypothetical protein